MIGIILLVILGLILLILLIVLLVPVRLDLKARYDESVRARGHVTWLLHAVNAKIEWMKDHGLLRVKLLGLKTVMKKHLGDWGPKPAVKPAAQETAPEADTEPETGPAEEMNTEAKPEEEGAQIPPEQEAKEENPASETEAKPEEAVQKPEGSRPEEQKPEEETSAQKPETAQTEGEKAEEIPHMELIEQKLEAFVEKIDEIQGYIYDDKNRKTVRRIVKQLKRIGRHLKPTKFQLEGELGFDDPCRTGKIMGLIYSAYPIYGEHIRIEGNYEEPAMKFYLELKGRVRLGLFVSVALHLLTDRNLIRWIKKLTGKDKTKTKTAKSADKQQKAA